MADTALDITMNILVQDILKKRFMRIESIVMTKSHLLKEGQLLFEDQKNFNQMYDEHIETLKQEMYDRFYDKVSEKAIDKVLSMILRS